MTRELSSKPSGSRCLEFADAAPGMRSNSGPYPGKNPGGETFLAPTRGEHSKSWGTDVVGLGSGLNGKRVGLVPKTSCPFPAPGNPGREARPGLCPGPAKGTALGTSQSVVAASA